MKNTLWLLLVIFSSALHAEFEQESIDAPQQVIILSQEEIDAIIGHGERYVYFGPEVCSAIHDLPYIQKHMVAQDCSCQYLTAVCSQIAQGKTIASFDLIDAALYEASEYLSSNRMEISQEDAAQLLHNLEEYLAKLETGSVDLIVDSIEDDNVDPSIVRGFSCLTFRALDVYKIRTVNLKVKCDATINGDLTVDGNEIIKGDLTVNNNEFVDGNLTVSGNELVAGDLTVVGTLHATISPIFPGFLEVVGAPQEGCIIFVDDALVEKARICTSTIPGDNGLYVSVDGGVTQNLRVNNEGGTVLAAPTSGAALSVTGNAGASAIVATGNGTGIAPALTLIGNPASTPADSFLTIDTSGVVREVLISTDGFIMNGCQAGPLTIGTNDATSLVLATNGCNPRVTIDQNGAVTVLTPTAGEALTVNGNVVLPVADAGGTQGILKLGGTGATRVNVYEFGTRNLFAGSGAVNSGVTGTDNISIGTTANSALTTQNNTIAIGNAAQAIGTDSITIGDGANTSAARTVVLGSADSAGSGAAPTASALNAIAVGSASGTNAGAFASGIAAVAIGGSGGTFAGASAAGDQSIALGVNASSSSALSIAMGSASGISGGVGPLASNTNAIAIGGANGANAGALASGISSISIGGAGPVFSGAISTGDRSIALGLNATTTVATSIAVGSASGVAGGLAPTPGTANSIAIGSANGTQRGASALGTTALSIGGSDGVFPGAQAGGARSIAIGVAPICQSNSSILIGSASGTAGGLGPNTVERTAICIGSARNAQRAANAGNTSSIAIGGSDGITPGPSAGGVRSIAIGLNANTAGTSNVIGTIVLGSASAAGGLGPVGASNNNISIGSANGAQRGANTLGASTIAIGGSDGTFPGASTSGGARSVAIGNGATIALVDGILLGNTAATAVKVGIGKAAPAAKLDIVGVDGTPVIRFDQVNTGITNAPRWLNPSTSTVAGTPIHYNASSHKLFGFTSSERYKTNIRPINSGSEIIYQLNPVFYDTKEGCGDGHDIPGFIAEDVNLIAPNLVIFNADNQPENVAYNSLHAFTIEELQKHQQQLSAQNTIVSNHASALDSLLCATVALQTRVTQYSNRKAEIDN